MGIGKFFSNAANLLFLGVGISDAGTIPRKIDLSKIGEAQNWRLLNCSASPVVFKGKEAVRLNAKDGEGLALYEGLELSAGKVDLSIAGISQNIGLVVRARSEQAYEVIKFEVDADNAAQRLALTLRLGDQHTVVELSPRLIDEWLTARVVLAREFTAVFLNNSNTPSLKVSVRGFSNADGDSSTASNGKIGFQIGNQAQALVADLKYIQTKKRDFE